MSTNPEGFADRPVPVRPLDEAQARLLEILRAAGGRPVSFAELRDQGLESPAVLCYELEIAGLPITHVERPNRRGTPVPIGVQLDEQALAATGAASEPPTSPSTPLLGLRTSLATAAAAAGEHARVLAAHATAPAGGRSALSRALATAARLREHRREWDPHWEHSTARRSRAGVLLGATAVAVVVALAIGLASGSGSHPNAAKVTGGPHRARTASSAPAGQRASALVTHAHAASVHASTRSASEPHRATPGEGADRALQLQGEGHQLLAEGRYAAAAADLRAAIAASGGSPGRCAEPSTESCLAYAYALYDLGRALQAEHEPGAAVPILDERLRIDNQRPTVLAQLNSARRQMHSAAPHQRRHADARAQTHSTAPSRHGEANGLPSGPEATGEQPQPPPNNAPAQGEADGGPPSGSPSGAEAAPGGGTNG